LDIYRVKQVACGAVHSLALTEDGQVLAWGLNDRGQLGLGLDAVGQSFKPKFIKAFANDRIVQLACGTRHCLALGEDGKVWAWGENSSGQLGNGTYVFAHTPFVLTSLNGRPIRKVACGASHSMVLSMSGRMYSWGDNSFGQLGTGDTTKLLRPQILKSATAFGATDIACGESHSAFVSRAGKVYTFGAGSSGQLGHQGTDAEHSPKALADMEPEPGTVVACGRRHTLVYQPASHHIFSFGLNASGQLGQSVGSERGTSSPFAIRALDGVTVKSLVCGGDQSFALLTRPASPTGPTSEDGDTVISAPRLSPPIPRTSILYLNKAIVQAYLEKAAATSNYGPLQHLVEVVFSSISCVNASFLGPDHFETSETKIGLDFSDMRESFKLLFSTPDKSIANTVGNACSKLANSLHHFRTGLPECMRVYLVVLFNPLFMDPSIYHIVCQKVVSLFVGLQDKMKEVLAGWISHLPSSEFFTILEVFQKFLSFLVDRKSQLGLDTSVTSCCLVLRWLFAINLRSRTLPLRDFYNHGVVANVDLQQDYVTWTTEPNQFSFCQYPFLLDLDTKTMILHIDARQQMSNEITHFIRQALSDALIPLPQPHDQQQVRIEANPFLLLNVRRENLLQDCLSQLAKYSIQDFKRPLVIHFEGEEGQDEGGLRKEFFNLVAQDLVNSTSRLLSPEESNLLWFSAGSKEPETTYRLIGVLIGMAIYNGCLIDLPFPEVLYKKLLGVELTLNDLAELKPTLAKNLAKLLESDAEDFEDTFGLTFEIQEQRGQDLVTVSLLPNGGNIPVTKHNRGEFVRLYVSHVLNNSVQREFSAFATGFKYICSGPLYSLFQPSEVEVLVRGTPSFDFFELEKAAVYDGGYDRENPVIKNFWKIFHSMPPQIKKRFLHFLTGSDRVPVSGLAKMRFVIQQVKDTTRLPAAHTCFNILDLPAYGSITELQEKLVFAITNTEGFGLV